ncbi:DUF2235 domain-containing protein [Mycolicibacterium porcinum]|uniref:DUF2235 domain-containing protein n=1 Tax=Mycolicibacterium porcinum TaxID=39693 RepID=UPI001196FD51|nr:DUF2235 domain-containing protein [Mycolicibacterium porcinum]TVX98907.1 DUF2235 domain-containing protein [Mycolicibacterium porcinum]
MTSSSTDGVVASGARNLVVCLDGTTNEPEAGTTNVARMFDVATKDGRQQVYYDPGVGTLAARGAITPWGQLFTRVAGMAIGYGIKDDLAEAYTWLMRNYREGDRIFVFGFSRGAYAARALTGMLRTVGLLHADADNMVPYALKLYASSGPMPDPSRPPTPQEEAARATFWRKRNDFRERFSNIAFPNPFEDERDQVHFLGVWDTVKSVGWLNVKARVEMARWPFTRNLRNVANARHALAIDEKRRPFTEYRFDAAAVEGSSGRFQERWFAGVHSDIGGEGTPDNRLPDIAFAWMVQEAVAAGLLVNDARYHALVGVVLGAALPPDRALGVITPNKGIWRLARGWRVRPIPPSDDVDPSVYERIAWTGNGYAPRNLPLRA